MKKFSKYLLLLGVFLTFGAFKVNAETNYVEGKKYTFNTIVSDTENLEGLIQYNNGIYAYDSDVKANLYELTLDKNRYTLKPSTYKYNVLDNIYPNKTKSFYSIEEDGYLKQYIYNVGMDTYNLGKKIQIYNPDYEDLHFLRPFHYNDKITLYGIDYSHDHPGRAFTDVYNENLEYLKSIWIEEDEKFISINMGLFGDESDPLIKLDLSKYNYTRVKYDVMALAANSDPYIVVYAEINNGEKTQIVIYDFNGKEKINFIEDTEIIDSNVNSVVMINNKLGYLYYVENNDIKTYYVYNQDGKKLTLDSGKELYIYYYDGMFAIENADKKELTIYDNNLNKIHVFKNNMIDNFSKIISTEDDALYGGLITDNNILYNQYFSTTKEIMNDKYLLGLYKEDGTFDRYELLTIEDVEKTTITGTVKDKDGNPLKNYTVELHSTPRTVKTDENGYFKFENVEEGEHTLTIINPDGKVISTKKINLIASTETRVDGDNFYFNKESKGFDIELKVDGDKLVVEKVLNEPKEKGIIAKLLNNEKVPKTADSIAIYVIALITFISGGILLKRKINKLN